MESLLTNDEYDEYSESKPKPMKIRGRDALGVKIDIPQEERKLLNIYLNNDGVPIILSYMADNLLWNKYYPISKKIIESIKFVP